MLYTLFCYVIIFCHFSFFLPNVELFFTVMVRQLCEFSHSEELPLLTPSFHIFATHSRLVSSADCEILFFQLAEDID